MKRTSQGPLARFLFGRGVVATMFVAGDAVVKAAQAAGGKHGEQVATPSTALAASTASIGQGAAAGATFGHLVAGPIGAAIGSLIGLGAGWASSLISSHLNARASALQHSLNDLKTMAMSPNVARLIGQVIQRLLTDAATEAGKGSGTSDALTRLAALAPQLMVSQSASLTSLSFTETDVAELLAEHERPARDRAGPSEDEWAGFLRDASGLPLRTDGSVGYLERAIQLGAAKLADGFTTLLPVYAEQSFVTDPRAFASAELLLLRALATALGQQSEQLVGVVSGQQATAAALEAQREELAQLRADLAAAPDRIAAEIRRASMDVAAFEPQIAAFRELLPAALAPLESSIRAITEEVARLARSLQPTFDDLIEQPWLVDRQRRLPFHFSLETDEASLFGRFAREEVWKSIDEFLGWDRSRAWWIWTGLDGAGKSRLAMHACQRAVARGWTAGFVTADRLIELAPRWRAMRQESDVLIVLDNVATNPGVARDALAGLMELGRDTGSVTPSHKVRVLVIERHARGLSTDSAEALLPDWFTTLFQDSRASVGAPRFLDHQFPRRGAASFHIGDFDRVEAEAFAFSCAQRELTRDGAAVVPRADEAERIARRTVELLWADSTYPQGRPLHVRLTARILASRHDTDISSFEDVIRRHLEERIRRRRAELAPHPALGGDVDKVLNAICLATLLRSVHVREFERWSEWLPSPEKTLMAARAMQLGTGTPGDDQILGIGPDLVGEWFVRMWCEEPSPLGGTITATQLLAMADAVPDSTARLADFVQRTYRPFQHTEFWRTLRNRLGRYSTPFGRLFDSELGRQLLFGDSTRAANDAYSTAIDEAIAAIVERSDGNVIMIDLMAGGSSRLEALLAGPHGDRLSVLAIDRDDARLRELSSRYPQNLKVIRSEIRGAVGLRERLHEAFELSSCDLVIMKKGLHELPWPAQTELIVDIGKVVNRRGRVIVYADSPVEMDEDGRERWERLRSTLHLALRAAEADPSRANDAIKRLLPPSLRFRADRPSDSAVFANFWAALKDWSNYNQHEYTNRYFSSLNELLEAFHEGGFVIDEASGASVARFSMRLNPARFLEDAINRVGYLSSDPDVSVEQIEALLSDNWRHVIFRQVVAAHLWSGGMPTEFGASALVNARMAEPFDPGPLLTEAFNSGGGAALSQLRFPVLECPEFDFPVHVIALVRPLERTLSGRARPNE